MKKVIVGQDGIVGPWVCARAGGSWVPGRGTTIGLMKDDKLVAGVLYEDFNGANVLMHVAGVGKYWLNRTYLHFVFWYPFEQLQCSRVTAIVPASNEQAMTFDLHLGFTLEAVLQDAHPTGDLNVLVMHKKDCRWIGDRNARKV